MVHYDHSSTRFTDVPAFSQVLLRRRGFHLRTIIVIAAVHRGFSCPPAARTLRTSSLNLPTLGRPQPVYFLFNEFAQTCVFVKQSFRILCVSPRFASGQGISLSYAQLFCLIPQERFSRKPWYSLPVHLCRFTVRVPF